VAKDLRVEILPGWFRPNSTCMVVSELKFAPFKDFGARGCVLKCLELWVINATSSRSELLFEDQDARGLINSSSIHENHGRDSRKREM
jgi:hypothetical protein